MRILQVIPALSRGGAEAVVIDLSNSLAQNGHAVTVLLAHPVSDAESRAGSIRFGIDLKYLSDSQEKRFGLYRSLIFFIFGKRKFINQFDVVHCHLSFGQFFGIIWKITTILNLRRGPRFIYTCHNVGANSPKWKDPFDQFSTRFFDAFVLMAQNRLWRDFTSSHKKSNIFLIENGISMSINTNRDRSEKMNRRVLTIGTISRLQSERKPWRFLEVFAALNKISESEFQFVIGGDGPLRSSLEAQALALGLGPKITFRGMILDSVSFIDSLDVYLSLNVRSTTGIAGLEAVFTAVPVVAIQALPNYKYGNFDWIWSDPDPEAVAAEIFRLSNSPEQVEHVVMRQQQVAAERFTSEIMTLRYQNIYSSPLSSGKICGTYEIHLVDPR
jgi:glycosyltransferase involved in cell wall biosynthesis